MRLLKLILASSLIAILLSVLTSLAIASDQTKVNLKGTNSIKLITFHNIDPKRVTYLDGEVTQSIADFIIHDIKQFAKEPQQPAYLVINSPGGGIVEGMTIIKAIRGAKTQTGLHTICIIDSFAASMAAIIASFCHETYATEDAVLMFHKAFYGVAGDQEQVLQRVKMGEKYIHTIEIMLTRQLGIPLKVYEFMRRNELWLVGDDIARFGFIDGIVNDWFILDDPKDDQLRVIF